MSLNILLFYLYLQINSIFSLDSDISFARTIPYLKFFIFVLVYKNFIEQNKIKLKVLGYLDNYYFIFSFGYYLSKY